MLDELAPPQRVAFILHDVFGMPFEEISRILGTAPRGRPRSRAAAPGGVCAGPLSPGRGRTPTCARPRRVVSAFLKAAREGDLDGLVAVLHLEVTRTADPQALPAGAPQRVRGVRAVVAETRALRENARRTRPVTIDGRPGIAIWSDRRVHTALIFRIAGGRITHYDVVADPHRLARLRIEESPHIEE